MQKKLPKNPSWKLYNRYYVTCVGPIENSAASSWKQQRDVLEDLILFSGVLLSCLKQRVLYFPAPLIKVFLSTYEPFLTTVLHRGLRNDFFFLNQFTFSNFYLDLYFPSLWTSISLFSLDFYFPFSLWTFIFLLFPFFWTFIQSCNRSQILDFFQIFSLVYTLALYQMFRETLRLL